MFCECGLLRKKIELLENDLRDLKSGLYSQGIRAYGADFDFYQAIQFILAHLKIKIAYSGENGRGGNQMSNGGFYAYWWSENYFYLYGAN